MNKKIYFCLCIIFIALMSGCDNSTYYEQTSWDATTEADGLEVSNELEMYENYVLPTELEAPEEFDENMAKTARGANDFAFRLSAQLVQNIEYENFVFSPYSVWLPLASLLNATDEANADLLSEILTGTNASAHDVNRASSRMLYNLIAQENSPLKIANAIFVDDNLTLRNDFIDAFMNFYRGTATDVDFTDPETVDIVNLWVYEQTNGLIPRIVGTFCPATVLAILNAIYFYDSWEHEFVPGSTSQRPFYSPSGTGYVPFMICEFMTRPYFEDDFVQATRLGFYNGGGMFIILPRSGDAVDFLANMTLEYFEYIHYNAAEFAIRLELPKFAIESTLDNLDTALTELGIPLFCGVKAPLTNSLVYENNRLWVTSALQKAMIDVNEQGTTAAAVTMMVIGESLPPPAQFEMICNTPFVFVLYQDTFDGGKQVLFVGVVNEP